MSTALRCGLPPFSRKGYVCGQSDIAGHLLPCELEGIGGRPHIFAAASENVGVARGIVLRGARVQHGTDVSLILKESQRGRTGLRTEEASRNKEDSAA